jgi:hypothetical protein
VRKGEVNALKAETAQFIERILQNAAKGSVPDSVKIFFAKLSSGISPCALQLKRGHAES